MGTEDLNISCFFFYFRLCFMEIKGNLVWRWRQERRTLLGLRNRETRTNVLLVLSSCGSYERVWNHKNKESALKPERGVI